MSDDQDWRLKVSLPASASMPALDHLLRRVRSSDVAAQVGQAVPHDVAVTHDGSTLFVYAGRRPALECARSAVEQVLRNAGIEGAIAVSHWDVSCDTWLQVDPPLSGEAELRERASEHDEERVESRTMVASAGKLVRAEVEQTMRDWAQELGLRCELIEHPHLLTTQVAFTVTGPSRKIDEFAEGLRAEELATFRTERAVMLSPL